MRVRPEYFSWSLDKQDEYRMSVPENDLFRIRQTILQSLFQINVKTDEEMDAALELFHDAQYARLNSTLLLLQGIGEDCFWLNESLGEHTLRDFTTLYDYDYADHSFQETARSEESPDYAVKPYRCRLHLTWARLFIDGRFHYATLSMAAAYILSAIDDAGEELIGTIIPHKYVHGKNHGKRKGAGTIYDMVVDAAGQESQLHQLRDRFLKQYLNERYENLQQNFDQDAAKTVFFIDKSTAEENNVEIIFTDQTALRHVRLRSFMQDCRSIQDARGSIILDQMIEREKEAATEFIHRTHQDICKNYDPGVVEFRKRRQIVVADNVMKRLS